MTDGPQQTFAFGRRYIRAGMIDKPAEALNERSRSDPFEILNHFRPVKPAASRRQNIGRFSFSTGKVRAVHAVNPVLLAMDIITLYPSSAMGPKPKNFCRAG